MRQAVKSTKQHSGSKPPAKAAKEAASTALIVEMRSTDPSMEKSDAMPSIGDLDCLDKIFSYLSAKDVAQAMCVQKQWHRAGCSERLWKDLLEADWGILAPVTITGATLNSHREAYRLWEQELGRYNGPHQMPKRAAALWHKLETWFHANIPSVAESLQPGLTEQELDAVERSMGAGAKLPPAFRLLYRFHNGQQVTGMDNLHGLFGGYSFYGESVNTGLMQLADMRPTMRALFAAQKYPGDPSLLLFAASAYDSLKIALLDTDNGEVWTPNIEGRGERRRGVRLCPPGKTVLDWFEEFANRLESGMYQATSAGPHGAPCDRLLPALSLFPASQAGGMVEEITQGVRIRASAVYCPERSTDSRHFFTYSIRYYLLAVEEQRVRWPAEAGPFRAKLSVQLQTRKWYIRDGDGIVYDIVEGPGVVGNFPILTPGGEEFAYQSCNHSSMPSGSMDGYFTFIEGTIARPAGPSFNAVCPRFQLVVPDYSY